MSANTDVQLFSTEFRTCIDRRLQELIDGAEADNPLTEALRYSLLAPGKRLRPLICLMSCHCLGGPWERAIDPACAVETIHAASLIVDDLPCMDDATTRRDLPACHRRFGEATAVLAALELMTLAYRVMSESPGVDAERRTRLVQILARAVGVNGMIGGQERDLASANGASGGERSARGVARIHALKTSSLFIAAAESGAVVAGVEGDRLIPIRKFAARLGLAYQTMDDLLDVQGSPDTTGKDVGQDADKLTLVDVLGEGSAADYARNMIAAAMAALQPLGSDMRPLQSLVLSLVVNSAPAHRSVN